MKLNRKLGSSSTYNGIFLGTSASSTNSSGYFFEINTRNGFYQIFQDNNRNWVNDTGDYHAIKDRTDSSAINKSLNTWNILKIVKVGTNYTFYINNVVMHSFTNSTYDPHYVFLISFQIDEPTQILYDYVTLTF